MKMETPKANPQPRLRLTEARNERKLSQQQVADRIGTTHVNVSRWERGITRPSPYFRRKLCTLFGKTEAELDLLVTHEDGGASSSAALSVVSGTEGAPPIVASGQDVGPVHPGAIYDPAIPLPPAYALIGR